MAVNNARTIAFLTRVITSKKFNRLRAGRGWREQASLTTLLPQLLINAIVQPLKVPGKESAEQAKKRCGCETDAHNEADRWRGSVDEKSDGRGCEE